MKKLFTKILLLISLAVSVQVFADENTVLMFIREGSRNLEVMLEEEVQLMKDMLEAEGYRVEIATIDGEDLQAGSVSIAVNHKIADVDMDDFGAIALPCMAPPPGSPYEVEVVQLVQLAAASDKPIAASRGAVGYLAEAGVLQGKRYAYASPVNVEERPSFRGGTFTGTGTETDGLVTTNGICPLASRSTGLPDGTGAMTRSFIETLNSRS
ncbi:MAG: DJ-1/PfpI family protein [Pseudomonadales bacterium]|nr:DJ-1/PfpI family protein [Pseudomonadales bacterium]